MTLNTVRKTGCRLALAGLALAAALPSAAAQTNLFDGNLHFSVTPYLWLPNINADLNYDLPRLAGNQFRTEIGPNDYLEHLKFAVMLSGEVRKGNWSAFTDLLYLDLGNEQTRVRDLTGPRGRAFAQTDLRSQTSLQSTVWTLAGAYTLTHGPMANLDLLFGFRYLGLDTDLKWQFASDAVLPRLDLARAGQVGRNRDQWDAIIGIKGQVSLGGGQWFMPYYADIGGGDSNLTWQGLLGVGYRFGWGDVTLAIRSLSYELSERDMNLRLTGPALGFSFRW